MLVHPLKIDDPDADAPVPEYFGKFTVSNAVQPLNASLYIRVVDGKSTTDNDVQFKNADELTLMQFGKLTFNNEEQLSNAFA